MLGRCDCCWLVDRDGSAKPVQFCGLCQAWLCELCRGNAVRRANAAWLRLRQGNL